FKLAEMLYDSIRDKIKPLSDSVVIYPGHGAGSACGKNIIAGCFDTLGNQKKTNYVFNDNLTKDEFVELATTNLSTPPQYFFHDVMMNKKGYNILEETLIKSIKPLKLEEFKKL